MTKYYTYIVEKCYMIGLQILFLIQKVCLLVSYSLFRVVSSFLNKKDAVIGVDEIASSIVYISKAIQSSYSVSLSQNKFYSFQYSYHLSNSLFLKVVRIFYGPILLGYLANKTETFIYVWKTGYLLNDIDGREYEFSFLKKRRKKLILYFCGNDVRSPKLMLEYAKRQGVDLGVNYYSYINPQRLTEQYESAIKRTVYAAELYADHIINASMDQMSYFTKVTIPFIYFYPDDKFFYNPDKFVNPQMLKILHAPSSPITKGTPLVRAAITRLRLEGYSFEYIELIDVPNEKVLDLLRTTHIVLNEFYAFIPGVFGVEAMASHCALLTAADENIESDLPAKSNTAWLVTKNFQVYDNLKFLLDHPEVIKEYADQGYLWADKYAKLSQSGKKITDLLLLSS